MRPQNLFEEQELTVSVLSRFPREIVIGDGTKLTLAQMVASDWQMLEDLLRATPDDERQFFRHDVSDAERVKQWCSQLDYRHNLPLLAWHGGQIVADATLEQEPGFWTAHVGKVRLLVRPDFRCRGVATTLMESLIELAGDLNLHRLVYECAVEQTDLMNFLMRLKFKPAATLPEFIRDRNGQFHDMVLLVHSL
jgi:RimJ/RimL family protein N-acetyltransferase